jgi:hypothetical protein
MHIILNYTLKKNVVKNFLPLVMALLQGTKNLFKLPTPRLADMRSRRVDGESTAAETVDGGDGRRRRTPKNFLGLTVVINERIL